MSGAVLINKGTGQPEWVAANKINDAIGSGNYFSKSGKVNVTASEGAGGGSYSTDVTNLAGQQSEYGLKTASVAGEAADTYDAGVRESYDNTLDKFLAFAEGGASSLTFGAADVFMDDEATRMRADVNSGWRSFGEVAGIIAPALVTGGASLAVKGAVAGGKAVGKSLLKETVKTALRSTPAGLGSRLAVKAGAKAAGRFAEGSATKKFVAAAVESAVEGAMWSTGQTLSEAIIEDKDLAAESVLAAVGQGAIFGGAVGGGFSALGSGIKALKGRTTKRSMQNAHPLFDLDSDVSKGFRMQLVGSADDAIKYGANFERKMDALKVLESRGAADAYQIAPRQAAFDAYKGAKKEYKKFLRLADDMPHTPEEMEGAFKKLMQEANKKQIVQFAQVLDNLHAKTSELDDLLKPRVADQYMPGGLQKKTNLAEEAIPLSTEEKWAQEAAAAQANKPDYDKMSTLVNDFVRGVDSGKIANKTVGPKIIKAAQEAGIEISADMSPKAFSDAFKKHATPTKPTVDSMFGGGFAPSGPLVPARTNDANRLSNDILNSAHGKMQEALPGFTGKRYADEVAALGRSLKETSGARFNALDALSVADALGMDVNALPVLGPVADSALKLWVFYRMGGVLGGQAVKSIRGKGTSGSRLAKNMLYQGVARKAAEMGRQKGGAFGAGAAYSAAYAGVKASVEGVSKIGSATGKATGRIKGAIDKVLTPGLKKDLKRATPALAYQLSNAAYSAPVDTDPKDDYGRIEAQLERSANSEKAMVNYLNIQFEDFRLLDAPLADALVKSKMSQIMYLYKKLPKRPITALPGPWSPPPSDMVVFKETALIHEHPDEAINRFEDGTLTRQNAEDFAKLWPSMHKQLLDGVLEHIDSFAKLGEKHKKMISFITGQPLTPTADPKMISYTQEDFMAKRKEEDAKSASVGGANSIKAGISPTPAQQFAGPQTR